MIRFGKSAQHAVMCLTCLAENYNGTTPTLSSSEISRQRRISRPTVAKALCALSSARIVSSNPGPGGGYILSRPPETINLLEVLSLFERSDTLPCCFNALGRVRHCASPLHPQLQQLSASINFFFARSSLATLIEAKQSVLTAYLAPLSLDP